MVFKRGCNDSEVNESTLECCTMGERLDVSVRVEQVEEISDLMLV